MALDPAFSEAFLHRLGRDPHWSRHEVMGRRLRPFSLWHLLLLAEVDSPTIRAEKVTPSDLVIAVALCRCDWPCHRVGGRGLWRRLADGWRLAAGGFARELARFHAYREDFESPPEFRVVPPQRAQAGPARGQPPLLFELLVATMKVARCGRAEAWSVSPGEAAWYRAEWLRERGADVDFLSAEVKAEQDELAQTHPELHRALVAGTAKHFPGGPRG